MLTFIVGQKEMWNPEEEVFFYEGGTRLSFEYTLKILSEWESKWQKPWLSTTVPKEAEEVIDMYRMMCTNVEDFDERFLTTEVQKELVAYINDARTATTFNHIDSTSTSRIVTSEVIYGAMANGQIPFECETWHLGRLLTLIQVISQTNSPKKKMTRADEVAQRRALNAQRRAEMNSKG